MTTQKNIQEARIAAETVKTDLEKCKIDLDAFMAYVDQINAGVWDAQTNVLPQQGPLTKAQAAMINVVIPQDYSYPIVFSKPEIWQLAGQQAMDLDAKCKLLQEEFAAKQKTLEEITDQYAADMDRANEIASKDPSVIAAKNNAEATRIQAATDLAKAKMNAESRQENVRMMVGAMIGLLVVGVVVIVIAKAVKIA